MAEYLLFDTETRPNEALIDNVTHAYREDVNGNVTMRQMKKMTVDDVKVLIRNENPCLEWLEIHLKKESEEKCRKGVIDEIKKRIHDLRFPLDKKWLTTPETQELITVAWSEGPDAEVEVRQYDEEVEYRDWINDTLVEFWSLAKRYRICGWNSAGFDVPILMQESKKIRVPYQRYKIHSFTGLEHNMMDLMKVRFPRDWRGLRASAMAVGMPVEDDEVDTLVTGSNVAQAYRDGEYDRIATHCKVDIWRLQHLFRAYEGLYF